jgi:hypothetical protein
MAGMEKREAARLLVLNAIYEASRGNKDKWVGGNDISNMLKLSSRQIGAACAFLEARLLIETAGEVYIDYPPQIMHLTARGIEEIEKSLQSPRESTEYLPPAVSVVHIEGNNIGSPIQSSSPGAHQNASSNINIPGIRDFIGKLKEVAPELEISDDARGELTAEIATLEAQVNSPRPKSRTISESINSVRAIMEGAGGTLTATGVLEMIQHLHF